MIAIRKYEDRFYLLFIALVFSLPLSIFFTNIIGALLFLNGIFANSKTWQKSYIKHPLVIAYLGFFAWNIVSVFFSADLPSAWDALGKKAAFIALPIPLALGLPLLSSQRQKNIYKSFLLALTIAALYSVLSGIYQYLTTGDWHTYYPSGAIKTHHLFYEGLALPLMHPAYFSIYTGIAILLLTFKNPFLSATWINISWVAFLATFLFMLQSRMTIIAFALIMLFYLIYRILSTSKKTLLGVALGSIILASIIIVSFLPHDLKERLFVSPSLEYDISAPSMHHFTGITVRLAEWHCAFDVITENFWIGTGIGDERAALLNSYKENGFVLGIEQGFNCHNQYLQTLLALGIPGLLFILAMGFIFIKTAIKNKDILLLTAASYFFLSITTESMLERHWAISLFCSFLLFLGLVSSKKPETSSI